MHSHIGIASSSMWLYGTLTWGDELRHPLQFSGE